MKRAKAGSSRAWEFADADVRLAVVGTFLKERRIAAGLTQADVARVMKYSSPQFVSNWERGLALPPLDVLPRLAQLLNVAPATMIEVMTRYQEIVSKRNKQRLVDVFHTRSRRA